MKNGSILWGGRRKRERGRGKIMKQTALCGI
jgi:hypothetical protein